MRNKKLSIIIPAYNAETYIEECLSSMIDFMADNLEILVVNDGSTDKTEEIAERCRQRDSRIVLMANKVAISQRKLYNYYRRR